MARARMPSSVASRSAGSPTIRPPAHDDDAVRQAQQLGQLGGDHQDGDARPRPAPRSAGRSRAWRRRRCRGSARRGSGCGARRASQRANTTFCWLPPESLETSCSIEGVLIRTPRRRVSGDRPAGSRLRDRRSRSGETFSGTQSETLVADAAQQQQGFLLAVLGHQADPGQRWRRRDCPQRVQLPALHHADLAALTSGSDAERSARPARCGRRRPARPRPAPRRRARVRRAVPDPWWSTRVELQRHLVPQPDVRWRDRTARPDRGRPSAASWWPSSMLGGRRGPPPARRRAARRPGRRGP